MEDNRKFATFFADAPKGKKIGAVLSWIATVILLVALFVPGYQLRYQIKTEKGTFKDIPATMTSELKQMKEAAKLAQRLADVKGRKHRASYQWKACRK